MRRLSGIVTALALLTMAAQAEWKYSDNTFLLGDYDGVASTVAWGDVNNDGAYDLFVGGGEGTVARLYIGNCGSFRDATSDYGLGWLEDVRTAQFIDYDNDGQLDLFCLVNNERGFTVARQSGSCFYAVNINASAPYTTRIRSAAWVDMNTDGRLDLMVSNGPDSEKHLTVYLQKIADEFYEEADGWFSRDIRNVGAITACDFDQDKSLDYLLGASSGNSRPYLFRNNGTIIYTDWAEPYDFVNGMAQTGAVWFDYNNDNRLDVFTPGDHQTSRLFMGTVEEDEAWLKDMTTQSNIAPLAAGAMYAHAVDADMNGWTDLFLVRQNGMGCSMLLNQRGEGWAEVAPSLTLQNANRDNRAAAFADYDNDGDLDVAIAQGVDGVRLYGNSLPVRNQYVALELESCDTRLPQMFCSATMMYGPWKKTASTAVTISSAAGDAHTLWFVNPEYQPTRLYGLEICWSDGTLDTYGPDEIQCNCVTTLCGPINDGQDRYIPPRPLGIPPNEIVIRNIPNPFNPTTVISFTVPEAMDVDLRVFNLLGQEVAALAHGPVIAGEHRITFDASTLPSGIYVTRLTAGNEKRIHRMLLAK